MVLTFRSHALFTIHFHLTNAYLHGKRASDAEQGSHRLLWYIYFHDTRYFQQSIIETFLKNTLKCKSNNPAKTRHWTHATTLHVKS